MASQRHFKSFPQTFEVPSINSPELSFRDLYAVFAKSTFHVNHIHDAHSLPINTRQRDKLSKRWTLFDQLSVLCIIQWPSRSDVQAPKVYVQINKKKKKKKK